MTYSPYVVTNSITTDVCANSTSTEVPATETEIPGTATEVPATETEVPGTATEVPATETEVPGTATEVPGTATEVPGTATDVPATETEVPATETEVPGTPTDEPTPTATIDPTDEVTPTPTNDGVVTPEAPFNLATNGISEAGIGLSWTNGDATLKTHLERSVDSGVNWTEITVVVPGGFTYTDTNVTCGTAYQYRARSYNSSTATFSDYSNTLSVTSNACGLDILINGKIEADSDNNRLPDSWTGKRLTKDKMVTNKVNRPGKPDKIVVYEGTKAFVFKSPAAQNKKLIQKQTNLTGLAGDTLTMNVYAKAKNLPENARVRAKLKIGYADGSFDKVVVNITSGSYDYTLFTHMPFVTPKDYTNVKVTLQFKSPSGKIYLDGMSLMLDFPAN